MTTIKEYLDYAELAQAAYGIGFEQGMYQSGYIKDGVNVLTHKDYDVKFSTAQATNFANRYRIIATTDTYGIGSSSGLDAVLFYDEIGKKYVMSISKMGTGCFIK